MTNSDNPSVEVIFPWTFVREWDTNYKSHHIFSETFAKISIYSLKMGVWNDLDEKQLWHKIKRGPFKSPPYSFQIGNLEDDIWTFEQIDKLRQSPIAKKIRLSESDFTNCPSSKGVWFYTLSPGWSTSWTERLWSEFCTDPWKLGSRFLFCSNEHQAFIFCHNGLHH